MDFIVRKDRGFNRKEFGRRQEVEALGCTIFMVTLEDLIDTQILAARGGSTRLEAALDRR